MGAKPTTVQTLGNARRGLEVGGIPRRLLLASPHLEKPMIQHLRRLVRPLARPVLRRGRELRYRKALDRGEAAGELSYVWSPEPPPNPATLQIRWPHQASEDRLRDFLHQQTLTDSYLVQGRESLGFYAPGRVPSDEGDAAFLENALYLLAAEDVDAVTLLPPSLWDKAPETWDQVTDAPWRHHTVFASEAWSWDANKDSITPKPGNRVVKVVPPMDAPRNPTFWNAQRRGPYLANHDLGPYLEVSVRDASAVTPSEPRRERTPLLVLAPFLARGGAEQTLHGTLEVLRSRFEITFVTLAPHRPELGDRRDDFRQISPRLFSLGDQVHPAAMPGILLALIQTTGAKILYNANGTTLFYDFAPQLKAAHPDLLILDHLYDHRVGYIDRYDRNLLDSVDLCVAENHPIQEALVRERSWPEERVPVIWPCGRPEEAFPRGDEAEDRRQALRQEFELEDDDILFLVAARMHPQKRPLDLVRLAERLRDRGPSIHFLLVGGGPLEDEVDRAIIEAEGARIQRLPFRPDIPDLLLAADVGCLVSDYEGLPVFLLECLQTGRPFLGTDVGDLGRVLRATGAGLVVPEPGDLDTLEEMALRFTDPALRTSLALRARKAAPQFSVEACAERYARAFLGREQPMGGMADP